MGMIIAAGPPRCASAVALSTSCGSTHLIFTALGSMSSVSLLQIRKWGHRKVNLPRIPQALGGGLGCERRWLAVLA